MSLARILPLTLALVAGSSAIAQEKEKHLLRLNFKAGTVRHYVMDQVMDMSMNMGAQDMKTKMTMSMFTTTKVKSVEGNNAALEQEITRVKAVMDSPMMSVNYDSDDENSDPGMLGDIADVVGMKSTMKLTDQGKMSEFKMGEDQASDIAAAGIDIEQMMSQSVVMFPEKPIAVGDTWTTKQKMPLGQMGETETEVHYKLLAVDGNSISLEQTLKIDTDEMEIPAGMEIEEITAKGTTKIDRTTGTPHEMVMNMTMKMTGQMSMTMKMTQTMKPAPAPKAKEEKKAPAETGK